MDYRITITHEAKREYRDIVSYLTDVLKNPQAARHFMVEFSAKIDMIQKHPEAFGLCHLPELSARGYRSASVMRYIFLYKILDDRIVVAHIFHQSQDYARLI